MRSNDFQEMNLKFRRLAAALALLLAVAPSAARAVTVSPGEMAEARRWAAAVFEGAAVSGAVDPGLEVVANYDLVQRDARFGKPLKLAGANHARGLFCHADSKIVVRLPSPGKTFEALVGVDSNEQTVGGRGSVVFTVLVGGKEAFRSEVLREGMPPVPVKVDLAGAKEFVIAVGDSGDGFACDQADWADARVALADGKSVWISDLPMAGGPAVIDPAGPPLSFVYDGRPSSEFLKDWKLERTSKPLDAQRTQRTLTYTDPKTGLVVRVVGVEYRDFPTVEWTVYFKNPGKEATPILENIQALDVKFARGHYGEFLLHHAVGSPCAQNDYAPLESPLAPGSETKIGADGRPAHQLRYVLLQPRSADRTRRDRRRGLAGPVVGDVRPATTTRACACAPARS